MLTVGCPRDETIEGWSKSERLTARILGCKGSVKSESKCESDRIIRAKVLRALWATTKSANMALTRTIDGPAQEKSEVIGKLIFQLNYIYDTLLRPSIGKAGLLEATKIEEDEVDKLVGQDLAIVRLAEDIEIKGKELLELAMRGDYDSITKVIEELQVIMSRIEGMASSREEVLDGR